MAWTPLKAIVLIVLVILLGVLLFAYFSRYPLKLKFKLAGTSRVVNLRIGKDKSVLSIVRQFPNKVRGSSQSFFEFKIRKSSAVETLIDKIPRSMHNIGRAMNSPTRVRQRNTKSDINTYIGKIPKKINQFVDNIDKALHKL